MNKQEELQAILAEMKKRGMELPQMPSMEKEESQEAQPVEARAPGLLEKAGNVAGKFNQMMDTALTETGIKPVAGGISQGLYDVLSSAANLGLKGVNKAAGTDYQFPKADFSSLISQTPKAQSAFRASELLSNAAGAGKIYKGLEAGRAALQAGKPAASLLSRAVMGAGTGYIAGEGSDPNRSYRIPSAILGGAIPLALGVSSRGISSAMGKLYQRGLDIAEKEYAQVSNALEQRGIDANKLRVPQVIKRKFLSDDLKAALRGKGRDARTTMLEFEQNPTWDNAHRAQSDLGKAQRLLQKTAAKDANAVPRYAEKTQAIDDARKRLHGAMMKFLGDNNATDIAENYMQATKNFGRGVGALRDAGIDTYLRSNQKAPEFLQKVLKNKDFLNSPISQEIPGLGFRRGFENLPKTAKAAIEYGLPAAAGMAGLGYGTGYYLSKMMGK